MVVFMGISQRWLKKGTEEPRCPMCHSLLYKYGDTLNYITETKEEIWLCTNSECDYKRTRMFKLYK